MPNMEIIVGTQLSNVAAQTTLDIQGIVTSMKASGMSNSAIKDTLMADLTGGGRIFGNYRNQVKNTVKSGVSMAGSNASKDIFTKAGVEKFRWQTVQGDTVCPDCEPRHGQIESMKVWEMIGTPQSGFSVCQQYCQCQLLPENYKGENLDKPLIKKDMADVARIKPIGKAVTISEAEKTAASVLVKDITSKYDVSGTAKTVSYKGIPKEYANAINVQLKALKDEYGIEINKITTIPNGALEIKMNDITYITKGVSEKIRVTELLVGQRWIKKTGDVKMMDFWTKMGKGLFANSLDDMITHEIGHVLTGKKILERGYKQLDIDFSKINKGPLSKYGKSSGHEALAEIFLYYKQWSKALMDDTWIEYFNKYSEQKI